MKKNQGFSIIELIVSFALTMIIVVILFEIIISLKNVYENSVTKSALVSRQNILTDYIYSDLNDSGLANINACGNNCIQFIYKNGDTKNLSWEYEYDSDSQRQSFQKIKYGDYAIDLITNSKFDLSLSASHSTYEFKGVSVCTSLKNYSSNLIYFLDIKIPIYNTKFENQDFGLNILYTFPYNTGTSVSSIPYTSGC